MVDAVGNRLRVQDNAGVRIAATYDRRNLLVSHTWTGGGLPGARSEQQFDAAGQRTQLTRAADAAGTSVVSRTTADYDANGRLTQWTHATAAGTPLVDYRYTYDVAGQLTSESRPGQTITYTHDAAEQLVGVDYSTQADETYQYDPLGNRIGNTTTTGNRLASDGQFNYTYDAEGNRTRKVQISNGEVTDYTYDYRNRLTQVVVKSAGGVVLSTIQHVYDVFDRRIRTITNGMAVSFGYDGQQAWADYNSSGQVTARYWAGERVDELLARWRPSEGLAWYLGDHQGTVRDLLNAAGVVVLHLDYTAFGYYLSVPTSSWADRFGFQGRPFDAASSLWDFRARWYDAQVGQFVSEDPLGLSAGDAHLRRFVFNAPTMYTDPSGMLGENVIITQNDLAIGGAAAGFVFGFICSYLHALFAKGATHDEAVRAGWGGAANGALIGGMIGYLAGSGHRWRKSLQARRRERWPVSC